MSRASRSKGRVGTGAASVKNPRDGIIRTMGDLYEHFGSEPSFRSLDRRIYKDTECGASISVCGYIPEEVDLWAFGDTMDSTPYDMGEGVDEDEEPRGEKIWFHSGSDGPPSNFVLDGFTIQTIVENSEVTVDSGYFKAGVATGADVDKWIEQMEAAADHEWRKENDPEAVREEWEDFFRDFFGGGGRTASRDETRTKKERLRDKLAAMTVERGCSPAEAATAKQMLDELDATDEPVSEIEMAGVDQFEVGDRVEMIVASGPLRAGDRGVVAVLYHDDGIVGVRWDGRDFADGPWAYPRELKVVLRGKRALRGRWVLRVEVGDRVRTTGYTLDSDGSGYVTGRTGVVVDSMHDLNMVQVQWDDGQISNVYLSDIEIVTEPKALRGKRVRKAKVRKAKGRKAKGRKR